MYVPIDDKDEMMPIYTALHHEPEVKVNGAGSGIQEKTSLIKEVKDLKKPNETVS